MGKRQAQVDSTDLDASTEPVEVVETSEAEAAPEKESTKGSVTVTWNGGTREFSKAVHGADFRKLAAQFAEKFKGKVA